MRERPILFSAAMVRAILDNRKAQTRRVVIPQPPSVDAVRAKAGIDYGWIAPGGPGGSGLDYHRPSGPVWAVRELMGCEPQLRCPYGEPGDRLWVREACWLLGRWTRNGLTKTGRQRWRFRVEGGAVVFNKPSSNIAKRAAEPGHDGGLGWAYRHARYMPRWASRITLAVTSVRVERLQAITEEDAIEEGLKRVTKDNGITWKYGLPDRDGLPGTDDDGMPWSDWNVDARKPFKTLWQRINGKRERFAWDDNPWVWVVGFERVKGPARARGGRLVGFERAKARTATA